MMKTLHLSNPGLYVVFFCVLLFPNSTVGQQTVSKPISMAEVVALTLANNPISKNAELQVKMVNTKSAISFAPTEVTYANGQFYSSMYDSYFEVNQHFGSPFTMYQKAKYNQQAKKLSEVEQQLTTKKLVASAKTAYSNCVYVQAKLNVLKEFNNLYNKIVVTHGVPYNPNDSNLITRIKNETSFANFQNQLFQTEQDVLLANNNLQLLLNSDMQFIPADTTLELYAIEILNSGPNKFNPATNNLYYIESSALLEKNIALEQSKLFPEIIAGYFNREINGNKGFQGFKIGIALPICWLPQKANIKEARMKLEIAKNEADYQKFSLTKTIESLKIQLDKLFVQVSFYRENALKKADLLLNKAFQDSEDKNPDYSRLFENLETALKIQLDYLETIYQYNHTAIQLESLID